MLYISEVFTSLQGEGQFAGHPMMFIRLSGCTRACSWCDTKYHTKINQKLEVQKLANLILKSKVKNICFTGGEPLLQFEDIFQVVSIVLQENPEFNFHLESNGDLLTKEIMCKLYMLFDYLAFSPKELKTCKKVASIVKEFPMGYEIKVVTDLKKEGVDMLKYATMLMPLTNYKWKEDKETMKRVWEYCVKNNKLFSSRLQYIVFGKKKLV